MVQCSDSFAAKGAAAKLRLDHSGSLLHAWGLLDPRGPRIALGALKGMKKGCLPFLADSLKDVARCEMDGG